MSRQQLRQRSLVPSVRILLALMIVAVWGGLSWTIFTLPIHLSDLEKLVERHLDDSGVTNPVTAVLMNFRGYDTLLEVAVLVIAALAVWSLPKSRLLVTHQEGRATEPILMALVRLLTPLMIIVGGYLLWAGAHAPGGAFQGGAIWAATLILLLLSGFHFFIQVPLWLLRLALVIGFLVFLAVSVGVMMIGERFLEYPQGYAKEFILLIEASVTVSIAYILMSLFTGRPTDQPPSQLSTQTRKNPQ